MLPQKRKKIIHKLIVLNNTIGKLHIKRHDHDIFKVDK